MRIAPFLLAILLMPVAAAEPADPYRWLEEVAGEKQLEWVRSRNAEAVAALAEGDGFASLERRLLAILDSDDKIPFIRKIGGRYYNFWRDAAHPRGLWRRTTLAEYRGAEPAWETVLDLDALAESEGENWVWHGARVLEPEGRLCLISLSRGGADADVVREVERLPDVPTDDLGYPDAVISMIGELAVYDHWRQRVTLLANVIVTDDVDLEVRDLNVALEFYQEKLGFAVLVQQEAAGVATVTCGGADLILNVSETPRLSRAVFRDAGPPNLRGLAVSLGEQMYVEIADPDGNRLLFEAAT